jgi:hypothetical protein
MPKKYDGIEHNDMFAVAQNKYLSARSNGDKKKADAAMNEMYKVCHDCAKNMLKNELRKNGIKANDIDDDIEDCCMYIITKYLSKPEFKINKLSAYMHYAVVAVLYNEKRKEREQREISLEELEEGNDNLDYQD